MQGSSTSVPVAPFSWHALGGGIVLAMAILILFLAVAEYSRKETVAGALVSKTGVVRVSARRDGIVTDLKAQDGNRVEAGQALFTIDSQQNLEGGGTLAAALADSLNEQIHLIREQIDSDPARVATEILRVEAVIRNVMAQRDAILAQRQLQAERIKAAGERRQVLSQLYQTGSVTKVALQGQEEVLLANRQTFAELDRQLASVERELENSQLQREQLPVQRNERLAQLRLSLVDRERDRIEVEARGAQVIRAPISGRVTALQVGPGQIVDANRPLLTIVPEDAELKAELFIPSRAIGFIEAGQRVRIMIDAFPYQRFGSHGGIVEAVSQAALSPDEVFGKAPFKDPAYRIVVQLDRQTIHAFGRQLPLQADMTVKADIILEKRSLMTWLFEPLISVRGRM
jgi:membrane fusion protein